MLKPENHAQKMRRMRKIFLQLSAKSDDIPWLLNQMKARFQFTSQDIKDFQQYMERLEEDG